MLSNINYEAYDKSGNRIKGDFNGSLEELQLFLKNKEYLLISYNEKSRIKKAGKFTEKDLIYFIEELLYLVESGMNIDKSINTIKKTASKQIQIDFFSTILSFLKGGNQFSSSLSLASKNHNIVIDNLVVVLIETNESVGNLPLGLKKVKEHLEFKNMILSEIKQALSYPIFLISMSILMVFFVFLFIVPKFSSIFTPEEFAALPMLSKSVLQVGLYVEGNIEIILFTIAFLIAFLFYFRSYVKIYFKKALLKIPVFNHLNLKIQLSYFFTSLSLMLEGGLDIKKALTQSKKIITYSPLKTLIEDTLSEVKKGVKISDTFSKSEIIPSNSNSLISAGENSGNIEIVFASLSKRFLEEFQKTTKALLSILEPAVIILMGGVIAVIVISIMLAVISITDIAG